MELGAAFLFEIVRLMAETNRVLYEGTAISQSGFSLECLHRLEPFSAERIDHLDGRQEFVTLGG